MAKNVISQHLKPRAESSPACCNPSVPSEVPWLMPFLCPIPVKASQLLPHRNMAFGTTWIHIPGSWSLLSGSRINRFHYCVWSKTCALHQQLIHISIFNYVLHMNQIQTHKDTYTCKRIHSHTLMSTWTSSLNSSFKEGHRTHYFQLVFDGSYYSNIFLDFDKNKTSIKGKSNYFAQNY